jgi:hypothetical protein
MTAARPDNQLTRDRQLWDEEAAVIIAIAPSLSEPARVALCSVLASLAREHPDPVTSIDIQRMLAAISSAIRVTAAA